LNGEKDLFTSSSHQQAHRIARELLLLGRPKVGFGLFQGQPNEDRYQLLDRTMMCKGMRVGRLLDVGERGYRFCSARHVRGASRANYTMTLAPEHRNILGARGSMTLNRM